MGNRTGATNTGSGQVIETRAHPVEGTEQREAQTFFFAVRPDHAVQQLFGNRIDPALFVDRPHHQVRVIFIEMFIGAHAVHFRCGWEDDAFFVFYAIADDLEVLFKIEFEHAQRVAGVFNWRSNRHQRQHYITFFDVILDPLGVNADITFNKVEARLIEETTDGIRSNIQTVNFEVVILQQTFGQVVTDEPVHTQNQHACTTFNRCNRLRVQQCARHHSQTLRQLTAVHINAIISLSGHHFQRAFSAGNQERFNGNHCAWLGFWRISMYAPFPHHKLNGAGEGKCARPWIGDSTYQVVN